MSFYQPRKFFKIMMPNHELQNGKLRIPKIFVDKYWKGMPNPLVLKFPNNAQQEVFWVEHDGDIWLQKNWEKIASFVKYGFVAVFKYIGGSNFEVNIFGPNGLEMDYCNMKFDDGDVGEAAEEVIEVSEDTLTKTAKALHEKLQKELKSNAESNLADTSQGRKNGKRKANMDFDAARQKVSDNDRGGWNKQAKKCLRTEIVKEEEVVEVVEVTDTSVESLDENNGVGTSKKRKHYKRKINVDFNATQKKVLGSNRGIIKNCSRTESVDKRTKNDQAHKNPNFEITLSQTYVQGNYLRIPSSFSRKYLKDFEGTAIIRFGEDIAIKVNLHFEDVIGHIMTRGWKPFAQKYNLQVDDVCNFEMTQLQPLSFIVTITPARKEQCRVSHNMMKQNSFKLIVNSFYPYIPNEFLDSHRELHEKFVELKMEGKSWLVKVKYYDRGSRFYGGWAKFNKDCKLEFGDVYLFKLIDEKNFVFEVSFLGKNQ